MQLRYRISWIIIVPYIDGRDLIEVGVNVTASREKEIFRNVRVRTRSGPALPGSSYKVYRFELRDRIYVSIIIPPKSRLAEIINFATQVWTIARVSALSPEIHFIFHLFHQTSGNFLGLKNCDKKHNIVTIDSTVILYNKMKTMSNNESNKQ
jgi:hypothetical protein